MHPKRSPYQPVRRQRHIRVAAALLLTASVAGAGDLVKPELEVQMRWTDNLFYSQNGAEQDEYIRISPQAKMQLGSPKKNYLLMDYRLHLLRFDSFDSEDSENFRLHHAARVDRDKSHYHVHYTTERTAGAEIDVADRVSKTSHLGGIEMRHRIAQKTTLKTGFNQAYYDYKDEAFIDSENYGFSGMLLYQFYRDLEFLGEVRANNLDRQRLDVVDDDILETFVGLNGKFAEKLKGQVKIGYQHRDRDAGAENLDTLIFDANLIAALRPRTKLSLNLVRTVNPTLTSRDNIYTMFSMTPKLTQGVGEGNKMALSLSGTYRRSDYEIPANDGTVRKDDYWDSKAELKVRIGKDIRLGLEVLHGENETNLPSGSYDLNQVMMSMRAQM